MRLRISLVASISAAMLFGLACNSSDQVASNTTPPSPPAPAFTPQAPTVHADGVRRVTTVELRDMLAKGQAIVIDVRNEASYNAGHIRGARLIPQNEVLTHVNDLPKNKLIVTYCS